MWLLNTAIPPEVLGSTFSSVVELLLSLQIQEAIQLLVPGVKLLSSLQCVTSLALEGNNLCRLLVTSSTVTSLTSLLRPPSAPTDNFRAERAGASSPAVPSDSALRGGARPLTSGPLPARPSHRPQEVPRTRGDAVDEGPDLELPRPQARGL